LYIKLRNGWPARIFLDALTQFIRRQNVDALILHTEIVEDLNDLTGETALRETRRALHEKHDVVGLHFIRDEIVDAGHLRSFPSITPKSRLTFRTGLCAKQIRRGKFRRKQGGLSQYSHLNAGNHPVGAN